MPETTVVTTVTQEVPPGEPSIPPVNGVLISPPPLPKPPPMPGYTTRPPGRLLFWFGITKHLTWALLLGGWGQSIQATPVAGLLKVFGGPTPLLVVLIASSVVACLGLLNKTTIVKVFCLLPQQYLMMITLFSSTSAVIAGHYADGTIRSYAFILADQLPAILAAIFHTLALIFLAKRL